MKEQIKAVILARVSTQQQDYDRQVNELTAYASATNMSIVKVFANKVSGAKKNEDRTEITELIEFVKTERIDKVLVLEISRLGRDTLEALKVIELLNQHKICLFVKNYNIETLDSEGKINPMTQFLATILLEISRMERTVTRQRLESGFRNHLSQGGVVGRRPGFRKSNDVMKQQYVQDIKLLRKGLSLRNIRAITGTSLNTLRKLYEFV